MTHLVYTSMQMDHEGDVVYSKTRCNFGFSSSITRSVGQKAGGTHLSIIPQVPPQFPL